MKTNLKKNIIFAFLIVAIGAIVFMFSQGGQSKSYLLGSETHVSITPIPTKATDSLSSANLSPEEFNQVYKEASTYLNSSPQYKCPDVATYYNWKLQFYKNNPQISVNEFSQRSNLLIKQNNYPYWACGVVFLKTYADQLGLYLQQHGYNTTVITPTPTPANDSSGLSNDNYYTNSNGDQVHSPAYSNTVPDGATAQCNDGTYSFSENRRGTCSHHGGVAQWL